eukprot:COSAG01_NODE_930_length_12664_cov_2.440032_3_plen_173_part_00
MFAAPTRRTARHRGNWTTVLYALVTTGGDEPPQTSRAEVSVWVPKTSRKLRAVCCRPARRTGGHHPSMATRCSFLRCALRAPRGANRGTQVCGGYAAERQQRRSHRPRKVEDKQGLVSPGVCGAHSHPCIEVQRRGLATNPSVRGGLTAFSVSRCMYMIKSAINLIYSRLGR